MNERKHSCILLKVNVIFNEFKSVMKSFSLVDYQFQILIDRMWSECDSGPESDSSGWINQINVKIYFISWSFWVQMSQFCCSPADFHLGHNEVNSSLVSCGSRVKKMSESCLSLLRDVKWFCCSYIKNVTCMTWLHHMTPTVANQYCALMLHLYVTFSHAAFFLLGTKIHCLHEHQNWKRSKHPLN